MQLVIDILCNRVTQQLSEHDYTDREKMRHLATELPAREVIHEASGCCAVAYSSACAMTRVFEKHNLLSGNRWFRYPVERLLNALLSCMEPKNQVERLLCKYQLTQKEVYRTTAQMQLAEQQWKRQEEEAMKRMKQMTMADAKVIDAIYPEDGDDDNKIQVQQLQQPTATWLHDPTDHEKQLVLRFMKQWQRYQSFVVNYNPHATRQEVIKFCQSSVRLCDLTRHKFWPVTAKASLQSTNWCLLGLTPYIFDNGLCCSLWSYIHRHLVADGAKFKLQLVQRVMDTPFKQQVRRQSEQLASTLFGLWKKRLVTVKMERLATLCGEAEAERPSTDWLVSTFLNDDKLLGSFLSTMQKQVVLVFHLLAEEKEECVVWFNQLDGKHDSSWVAMATTADDDELDDDDMEDEEEQKKVTLFKMTSLVWPVQAEHILHHLKQVQSTATQHFVKAQLDKTKEAHAQIGRADDKDPWTQLVTREIEPTLNDAKLSQLAERRDRSGKKLCNFITSWFGYQRERVAVAVYRALKTMHISIGPAVVRSLVKAEIKLVAPRWHRLKQRLLASMASPEFEEEWTPAKVFGSMQKAYQALAVRQREETAQLDSDEEKLKLDCHRDIRGATIKTKDLCASLLDHINDPVLVKEVTMRLKDRPALPKLVAETLRRQQLQAESVTVGDFMQWLFRYEVTLKWLDMLVNKTK